MGDDEKKIEYKPEELAEIERIVGFIGEEVEAPPRTTLTAVKVPARSRIDDEVEPESEPGLEAEEDLEFPLEEEPESGAVTAGEAMPAEEGEALEDISALLHEVDEKEAATLTEKPFPDEIEPEMEAAPIADEPVAVTGTPMEQLDALTRGEPESLDAQEISPEAFVDEAPAEAAPAEERAVPEMIAAEEPSMPEFEEPLPEPDLGREREQVSVSSELDEEIPDLSDLSLKEAGEMPEARQEDIPDIGIDDLGASEPIDEVREIREEAPDDFIDNLGEPSLEVEPEAPRRRAEPEPTRQRIEPGLDEEVPEAGLLDRLDSVDLGGFEDEVEAPQPARRARPVAEEEPIEIEMLDDMHEEPPPRKRPAEEKEKKESTEAVELSSGEMRRLKKAILLFNPSIRQAIKDTIINDLLSPQDTKQLINMIISGRSEETIHQHLQKKLGRTISLVDEAEVPGRRVITQRPEYTRIGRVRQKQLLRMTKIGGIAALVACVAMLVSYQFIYKPWMAKRMIAQGVQLILKSKDYQEKQQNFPQAEKLFKEVDEDYRKDYIEGYNAYGDAYFKTKEYTRSLDKFNRAYKLNPVQIETLNNLGYYYSRVPAEVYRYVRPNVNAWYFGGAKAEAAEYSQLDLAVHLYKRVLTRDQSNEKALYGIGMAFFHQGQFRKAQEYFRNIVRANPESVVGYSGLLNLYIEYDSINPNAFKLVVETHMKLMEKELLKDVPRALLAKLAAYYLTKQSTDRANVRIEYGVVSSRFKDEDDNIYPAVLNVLKALNEKDPNYPPLLLQYARLNLAQKNHRVMKRYLDKAVALEPNYFGALHLTGEYYYYTREPVQAYQFLRRAIDSHASQPEFTTEEFYHETESLGKTYALMGNIFYYFSDKVVFRFGDLDDEIVEDDLEKMANYGIAKEKYEMATGEKFQSPELHYNLGRIYYLERLYQKALDQWLHLYEDFVERPELMVALGNAFYHLGNYEASKGEYLKLISVYENEADRIRLPSPSMNSHVKVFRTLATAYNNLGAIYQLRNNEAKSGICYWKSIDYAKRLETVNEFARVNLARSFRERKVEAEPILDEDIPYSVDIYREDMR